MKHSLGSVVKTVGSKRGKPENLKPWPKGQSGNVSGRPKGIYSRDEIQAVVSKMYRMKVAEVNDILSSPESTMLEIHVANIMIKGSDDGSFQSFDGLMNRTIGKVQDKLQVTVPKPFIIKRSDGSEVVCGAELPKDEDD